MKAISKHINEKKEIILTCETSFLFGLIKRETQFIATKEYFIGYWNWRKMPDKTLVSTRLSFQLDEWCTDF